MSANFTLYAQQLAGTSICPMESKAAARRVLIVDDNEDTAESLSLLLQVHGHEVRAVHDGPAALAEVDGWRPQVAVLDIGLPGMDGFELAKALREALGGEARLIALSGTGRLSDRERARQAGFDAFLSKPAEPADLCRAM